MFTRFECTWAESFGVSNLIIEEWKVTNVTYDWISESDDTTVAAIDGKCYGDVAWKE